MYLREEVDVAQSHRDFVGQSPVIRRMLRQIDLVARTDSSVLILGESGTGKELIAQEIHKRSRRRDRPVIRVNCASIPRDLYESEFFGHVKGAFTGAVRDRPGRFEAANGGTLFLDEVGEIPLDLQSKLLRVLQDQQYERVGDDETRNVNVRIISSTNRNLKQDVVEGRFRQDLFYRLNVFPIEVTPLRRRLEDIPLLAAHLLQRLVKKLNCRVPRLTKAHVVQLQQYHWPGNVRELQNVIERALITSRFGTLYFDLPSSHGVVSCSCHAESSTIPESEGRVITDAEMNRRERENVLQSPAANEMEDFRSRRSCRAPGNQTDHPDLPSTETRAHEATHRGTV